MSLLTHQTICYYGFQHNIACNLVSGNKTREVTPLLRRQSSANDQSHWLLKFILLSFTFENYSASHDVRCGHTALHHIMHECAFSKALHLLFTPVIHALTLNLVLSTNINN